MCVRVLISNIDVVLFSYVGLDGCRQEDRSRLLQIGTNVPVKPITCATPV